MEETDRVKDVFESIDAMDTKGFLDFLTDDARFRFGSAEVTVGKEAIERSIEDFFGQIKGLQHRIIETWSGPEAVICQGEVIYARYDDSQVTVPFVNIWSMEKDLIKEYLIYIDISPLYSNVR
ncbi:MAG: nuclear transport factor 2 family protein [Planctomycetota bacterium]|jgi:ketosteroid isomerase-like protein